MQIKHSATRQYSDHLITFQSGLPHVPHQSLQDKGQILLGGGRGSKPRKLSALPNAHWLAAPTRCSMPHPALSFLIRERGQ